jgi:hypothetical protein
MIQKEKTSNQKRLHLRAPHHLIKCEDSGAGREQFAELWQHRWHLLFVFFEL